MRGNRSVFAWVQTALSRLGLRVVLFERRSETRKITHGDLAITWRDELSLHKHARVEMLNCSERGAAFRSPYPIPTGEMIGIRLGDGVSRAIVRHTRPVADSKFISGVEFCETYRVPVAPSQMEIN